MNYFGKCNPVATKYILRCVECKIVKWAVCKYERFPREERENGSPLLESRAKTAGHWSRKYSYC